MASFVAKLPSVGEDEESGGASGKIKAFTSVGDSDGLPVGSHPSRKISTGSQFRTVRKGSRVPSLLVSVPETGEAPQQSIDLVDVGGASSPPPTTAPARKTSYGQQSVVVQGKRTASTLRGKKTVRLSVLPVNAHISGQQTNSGSIIGTGGGSGPSRAVSFAPKRLLDIENGKSILVTQQGFLPEGRYQEVDQEGALVVSSKSTAPIADVDESFFKERKASLEDKIATGEIVDFDINSEVGRLGGAWRGVLRRLLISLNDEISGLALSRILQLFLPFQTGLEAYLLAELIHALETNNRRDLEFVLKVALKNRNVSRIIVQNVGARFDFIWHSHTAVRWNRAFDAFGIVPFIGITGFTPTENFPATRNHALASIFRQVLGEGNWITRVVTGGREGLVVDNPENTAQNLAAESNGFELANRNQFGTFVGRRKTNEFRASHRLPTDESIVRTFVGNPTSTMLNNGVEHVLRCLAKHWHNMLFQFSGNFAHQRMEQLDPFETLRFHMPAVLLVLSNLRGRNRWDSHILGPFIQELQNLKPAHTSDNAKFLIRKLKTDIILNVCGGIAARVDPFRSWADAMYQACDQIQEEAHQVHEKVTAVEIGIRLGYDVITQVKWKVPSDDVLKNAILTHINTPGQTTEGVSSARIAKAMTMIQPRDKRTLIELVKNGEMNTKPCQLLLGRAKTLLVREQRRELFNNTIRELSYGDYVTTYQKDEWYWLEDATTKQKEAYIYDAKVTGRDEHRFIHVDTKFEKFVSLTNGSVRTLAYIPIAESISRAQRQFMNIEIDNGKKFTYNGFMEFSFLRTSLRQLLVISQMTCEELDIARLNVLQEIQRSNQVQVSVRDLEPGRTYYTYNAKQKIYEPFVAKKSYSASDPEWAELARTKIVKIPPQNVIVVGGGPTGLTTCIHCCEAALTSGGIVKLYEARDAFAKGGSTFERAQIVRLDPRWISILRYHLGTGFEDVYIPATGETDAQLGNTLPTQGFVEITIKDLENMLHVELSKMWSKGLLQNHTQAGARYDHTTNNLTKMGSALKVDDLIKRRVNPDGFTSTEYYTWRVAEMKYSKSLDVEDLKIGGEYGIYIREENAVKNYKLVGVNIDTETYTFKATEEGMEDLKAVGGNLPSIYPKGTRKHAEVGKIIVESVRKGSKGGYVRDELPYKVIEKERFTLDVGHTHVIECIGKPHGSNVHFSVTTYEPYGVCCLQGLKVSMGMHNFGEKRWGTGLLDDFRSINDQNTRIIGDFTKMVRSAPVAQKMYEYMTDQKDNNWQLHWAKVCEDNGYGSLNSTDNIVPKIQAACKLHAEMAPRFKRQTLQTRFFETGDNYYLGMEFTREYDLWKNNVATECVASLMIKASKDEQKTVGRFRGIIMHHIDRLWYDACLETIRQGDVYNPGARHRVPRLYLINKLTDDKLGDLPVGESFRLTDRPKEKYEILVKSGKHVVVRNVEGYISKMNTNTIVRREGNLTRSPDGNAESRVALATFPVGHYVNFRTARVNDDAKGYIFAFIGDEQATPHFMRYSGLTGACINACLFNQFIKQAIDGVSFKDRFNLYSKETNWSNGEVVQRGTGANYGTDGFLRPGFPYDHFMDYMHSKVVESLESSHPNANIIASRDWKTKFAASMVPRGMELNATFIKSLDSQLKKSVSKKFIKEAFSDQSIGSTQLKNILETRERQLATKRDRTDSKEYWEDYVQGLESLDSKVVEKLVDYHVGIAIRLDQICKKIVDHATKLHLYNDRIASELENQPKPVDSIVDDFAVEAQNFANALVTSATYSAGVVGFTLFEIIRGDRVGTVLSAILAAFNIAITFGTMTNVSRYKIRNEESRVVFQEQKMLGVMKGVYSAMLRQQQDAVPEKDNPFIAGLEEQKNAFLKNAKYYDYDEPKEFLEAYRMLKSNINDPESIQKFMGLLSSKFIVDTYHVNSYMQENLVNIYKSCHELYLSVSGESNESGSAEARELFQRLLTFKNQLEPTLQRGPTRWGFIKQRKFAHWDIMACLQFFYSMFCFSTRKSASPGALIDTKTLSILKQIRYVSKLNNNTILRRENRDVEDLYWATRESWIASLIFMTAVLVHIAAYINLTARAGNNNSNISMLSPTYREIAQWVLLPSTFGAILAVFHFVRKFFILIGLYSTLGKKTYNATSTENRDNIKKVRSVTLTQLMLVVLRLVAAVAAAVALPWALIEINFSEETVTAAELPAWIAVGAVCASISAFIFFFLVEYRVRYNLSPKLGEFVCESFRDEIEGMYHLFELPVNDIDSKQVQEKETWEYVAREFLHKYRFDTVFAADRFGAILQYIQSGMDQR